MWRHNATIIVLHYTLKSVDSHDILHISREILKLKDTKIKSMRISETLLKKFDALADEHPNNTLRRIGVVYGKQYDK